MIELWAKNRILKADVFAFDRDIHQYDFKFVGGKRLVSSTRSGSFFFDINTYIFHEICRILCFVASHPQYVEYFWPILGISGQFYDIFDPKYGKN